MIGGQGRHRSSGHAAPTSSRPEPIRIELQREAPPRHRRMPPRKRFWIYSIVGLLWLSGALWFLLDEFFAKRGEFGATPHPMQPPLLLLHGVLAILSMFFFGWIVARHVSHWWALRQRRVSGAVLTAFLTILSATGFALFFLVNDASLHIAAVIHDAFGLTVVIFGIQHWFFRGSESGGTAK